MAKKLIDGSPKFQKDKHYAIGLLQHNRGVMDVPEGFSKSPSALYISGSDLLYSGLRSCRAFLLSDSCYFKVGSAVHFYEVEYGKLNEKEEPIYRLIFTGSPLISAQNSLNDMVNKDGHIINNIIPGSQSFENDKRFFKNMEEQIAYYQKCLQEERNQFSSERNLYVQKIQTKDDEILQLNLVNNTLKAELEALKIRYEEANNYRDRLESLVEKHSEPLDEPQGLADKTVGMLDGLLGDGASQQLAMGLATGLGNGISRLIDFGVDYVRSKNIKMQPNIQPQMSMQPQMNMQTNTVPPVTEPTPNNETLNNTTIASSDAV